MNAYQTAAMLWLAVGLILTTVRQPRDWMVVACGVLAIVCVFIPHLFR